MRTILVCLLLIPFVVRARQSSISFTVLQGAGKTVKVVRPLNGAFYVANMYDHTLNDKGTLVIPNQEKKPAAFEFYYKRWYKLFVHPGEQYAITVGESDTSLVIVAKDKEGQLALNRIPDEFYQTAGYRYYKEDSLFEHNKKRVERDIASQLAPFDKLLAGHAIDKAFYGYTALLVKYYYANVLGATLISPIMARSFHKDSVRYDAAAAQAMLQHWKDMLSIANVFDPAAMGVSTYFNYASFYNQWYLHYLMPNIKGENWRIDDYWDKGGYRLIQDHYREPLKEYLTASWMYVVMLQQDFQAFLPDWYNNFQARYPRSVYAKQLLPEVEKAKAYQEKIRPDFTVRQRFLEQADTIGSVNALAGRFANSTVFVDLWATWCGPCKAEFAFNDSLKLFLSSKNIEVLYISIDKVKAEKSWKDMIKFYNLEGYHVRASDSLLKDIYNVFGVNQMLSIPRYALIKNGKIIISEAKAPSEKAALYKQIEEKL